MQTKPELKNTETSILPTKLWVGDQTADWLPQCFVKRETTMRCP